ncbi:MAG: hypothetical protein ABIN80_18700 [Dyadobacter sp.]|uniref:hypothetical protein n=1 Tax=Dyadobacter sp. TaxID=1914288 RepID=UPI0032676E20
MKSFHILCTVLTIILSGERVSELLASNELVIFLIAGVLVFWYFASRKSTDTSESTEQQDPAPQTGKSL